MMKTFINLCLTLLGWVCFWEWFDSSIVNNRVSQFISHLFSVLVVACLALIALALLYPIFFLRAIFWRIPVNCIYKFNDYKVEK